MVDVGSVQSVLAFNDRILQQYSCIEFLFCNAGVLPSEGLRWGKVLTELVVAPMNLFIRSDVLIQPKQYKNEDGIANVMACNAFGHYLMIRGLESILEGPSSTRPGRVIWTGSITAEKESFDPEDWQGFESTQPYENSKWVTDLLAIRLSEVWAGMETEEELLSSGSSSSVSESTAPTTPVRRVTRSSSKIALETTATSSRKKNIVSIMTQPGVVGSGIGGLAAWVTLLRVCVQFLIRIFGEHNQTITPYHGAYANVHAALAPVLESSSSAPSQVDARNELDYRFKYGSAVGSFGKEFLKVEQVVQYDRDQGKFVLEEMELLRQGFLNESKSSDKN